MGQGKSVELATGIFIVLGLLSLVFLTTQTTNWDAYANDDSYEVKARFSNIGGLKVRAPVSMAGVTIGRVKDIRFDPERLDAVVVLSIRSKYDQLPADSSASILTAGLLGDNYVGLEPGADPEPLQPGDEILFTQSAMVLENLVSKYLFDSASGENE